MRVVLVLSLLVSLAAALPVRAQDAPPVPEKGTQWFVGIGAIASPRPYEGADAAVFPVPVFGVRSGPFFFETIRTGFRVVNTKHWKTDLLAQARFDGHEEDDSPVLKGMEERRMSADAGVRVQGKWDHVETEFTAVTDVLSRHEGQELGVSVGRPIKAGGWTITPGVGARWLSDNLADYYYGVELDEATADRPYYEVGSTINPRVEVKFFKPFAQRKWIFTSSVSMEWLGDEIRDSPIVDRSGTLGGFFAFIRTFS